VHKVRTQLGGGGGVEEKRTNATGGGGESNACVRTLLKLRVFFNFFLILHRLEPKTEFKQIPFDYFCPSIRDQLSKRICQKCGSYFPSQVAVKRHMIVHNDYRFLSVQENDDQPLERAVQPALEIPIFNVSDILEGPFEDDEVEF